MDVKQFAVLMARMKVDLEWFEVIEFQAACAAKGDLETYQSYHWELHQQWYQVMKNYRG